MSETKRKPPKLGPKRAAPSSTQKPTSNAASTIAQPKSSAAPLKKPASTAERPKSKSTSDQTQESAKPTLSNETDSSTVPQEKSAKDTQTKKTTSPKKSNDSAQSKKAPPASSSQTTNPSTLTRTNSSTPAKPQVKEQRRPFKLPPKPSNNEPSTPSDERRPSAVPREDSTSAARRETTEQKRKPPKLPPQTSNDKTSSTKPDGADQKRKPPKLPPKANNAVPSNSRRPSTVPRADSQPSVKSAQKSVKEEQDLKSILSEDQRTDLSQLVAGIARQMRKTIEDNFDSAANLRTLGRKEMSEDEKIASAEFDTGTVDVGEYDKERKLKEEREKELATPKLKELKRTALEWFDEWKDMVQKRVDETLEPKKGASEEKETLAPSLAEERPVQKVNTDAKSGEYSPPKLEELFPRLQTSLTRLTMQKRILVLHSILLLLLSLEHYNAASRVLLLYLASSLKLGLKYLREDEEKTAQGLLQAAKEVSADEEALKKRKEEGKEAHKWRVRLAAAAGAGVVGVAGGLAAPMIAAGVGTVMGGLGLEASTAAGYLGSLAGSSYLVGGLFGAYGGRMTGDMMEELSAEVEDFAFLPVHGERKAHDESIEAATESRRLRVIIAISGWLLEKEEVVTPWRVLKPSAEVFALRFELEALMNLGQSIDTMVSSAAYGYAQSAMIQRTVFAELMSAMWPVALVKVARVVDNPFTLAKTRADKAGKVLAEALINRTQGERPVTLVGYSLGARVIWSCLTTLAERKAFGLIESAVLIGSPLPSDTSTWRKMRTAVSGRLVNVYSENDYLLAFLYRTSSLQYGVAGLMPVSGLYGLENVDVSETVSGHLRYRYLVGSILQKIGFEDIDKGEVDKEAEAFKKVVDEESKHSYIEQAKEGYKGNKSGKPPKPKAPKDLSDADAEKQATAMEKEVQAKTKKGLMQWAVEQLYISRPSVPSTSDVKGAATDPQAAAKGATKTANKTADAATKSLYQRAIEAAYLARSGGEEGQKVAQDKLAEAQVGGPSSYLSTAAGYIPTSYIPSLGRSSLGRSSNATKTSQNDIGKAAKPPLKKTDSAQKTVTNVTKPILKKTDSMQKKVGDASKDQGKAGTDAQKTVTDVAKDPAKAATDTQQQVKNASKGVTDTATETGKKVAETASDPSQVTAEGQKQVGNATKPVTDTASKAGDAAGKAASDPSKIAKDGQKQVGDAAKRAGGVTSYIPSFGLGGSSKQDKQAAPKEASSTPSKQANTKEASKSLAQRAEESVAAEKKAAQDQKPADSGKKRISSASRPQKESSDSAQKQSSGYSSYLPHFGFGGSRSKPATPDAKNATKDTPKPEETAKDATKKIEDTAKDAQKTASEGTGEAKNTASDMASKAKDSGEDIFTSPPSKASNAFTKAASSATDGASNATSSATNTASNAAGSATNAASGAGNAVTDGAKSAEKYTPSMGGIGGDAGSKIGEMAGGAASGAKSGASFLGKGIGDAAQLTGDAQSKRGGAAQDASDKAGDEADKATGDGEGKEDAKKGYGKMASGLAGVGSRDKAVGGAVSQAGKGLSGLAGGGGDKKEEVNEPPTKEAKGDNSTDAEASDANDPDTGEDSHEDDNDGQSEVTQVPAQPIKMQDDADQGEGETLSDYNSASEEIQSSDEGSHKAEGTPDSEEKEERLIPQETQDDNPGEQSTGGKESKAEEPKSEESKGYLGAAGSAASSAGQGVVGGASSAGSAAGGAASSAASGVTSGVGKIGKGFGWS